MKVADILEEGFVDAMRHSIGGITTSKMDIVDLEKRASKLPPSSLRSEVMHLIKLMWNCRTFKEYQYLDVLKHELEQKLKSNQV
jgi:hypothetical protein